MMLASVGYRIESSRSSARKSNQDIGTQLNAGHSHEVPVSGMKTADAAFRRLNVFDRVYELRNG
jgi:hypothetical protein